MNVKVVSKEFEHPLMVFPLYYPLFQEIVKAPLVSVDDKFAP